MTLLEAISPMAVALLNQPISGGGYCEFSDREKFQDGKACGAFDQLSTGARVEHGGFDWAHPRQPADLRRRQLSAQRAMANNDGRAELPKVCGNIATEIKN